MSSTNPTPPPVSTRTTARTRIGSLCLLGLVLVATATWVRPRVAHTVQLRDALAAESLDPESLEALLQVSSDPGGDLAALWDSGRLPHRRAVVSRITHSGSSATTFPAELRARVLREIATDPDHSLREAALGLLGAYGAVSEQDRPVAEPLIAAQLVDADAELRRLGLQTLRHAGDVSWTPAILPLLADRDPSVAVAADALLRRWSGRDSGLRLANALPAAGTLGGREIPAATRERLAALGTEWRQWWETAPRPPRLITLPTPSSPRRRPLEDFQLSDLDGRPRSLAEFRGRTVLLNFWATWCGSCFAEMPGLVELQQRHPEDLVILGISLDTVGTEPAAGATAPPTATDLGDLRKRVRLAAARSRLSYPILLDPENRIGRRFDGGELPTQVLIDAQGRLVRRFLGGRPLEGWEALLAEAKQGTPASP